MRKKLTKYKIKLIRDGDVTEKLVSGRIYRKLFGISVRKIGMEKGFVITHLPTGYCLTQALFEDSIKAREFVDWVLLIDSKIFELDDIEHIRSHADPKIISRINSLNTMEKGIRNGDLSGRNGMA